MADLEAKTLERLKTSIASHDWTRASLCTDWLRFAHGWTYARFVEVFGERWEEYATEMDDADCGE